MKNILLIIRMSKKKSNLDLKYNGIINAFRRKGLCVWFTCTDNGFVYISNGTDYIQIGKASVRFEKYLRNMDLCKAVTDYIKKADINFDYCYIRSMPVLWGLKKMMKSIKNSNIKIAVEIPTYPSTTERKTDTLFRRIFLKISQYQSIAASKYIDVYLPMGEKTTEINGRPAVNLENGVEASMLNKRDYKPVDPNEIHMLAVAQIARWHGYDRIIEGMKLYYDNNPEARVYFHLVGPDGDGSLALYKQKIEEYHLEKYVLLEGPKYGIEADAYFNMADVGIASINIQGMKTVYPLKIVEYLARGIPFIYASSQCQVKPEWDFCMSVPTDGTPIDIDSIVAFSKKANSIENVSDIMRHIAETECSWDIQIDRILNFFGEE